MQVTRVDSVKVTDSTAIFYDPDPRNSVIKEDQDFVDTFFDISDIDTDLLSPWLLRVELNKKAMWAKNLEMEQVALIFAVLH